MLLHLYDVDCENECLAWWLPTRVLLNIKLFLLATLKINAVGVENYKVAFAALFFLKQTIMTSLQSFSIFSLTY